MRYETIDKCWDMVLLGIFLLFMFTFTDAVLTVSQQAHIDRQARVLLKTDHSQYPSIPQCEAELWERIKDGCK